MSEIHRTGRARSAVAAAAVLALVGGGLFAASPANAATSVTDNFEGNPYQRWTTEQVRGSSSVEFPDFGATQSGVYALLIDAYPPSVHSGRAYRSVTLDRPIGGASWCYAAAFVLRPAVLIVRNGELDELRPEKPSVTLQIRSGGRTGPSLSGTTYELPARQTAWRAETFASFAYQSGPLTVDITARSGQVLVDDVKVWCALTPR
ncbi:MAG TPA: hypothetical protein VES42_13990 [Pilimelia sp.]|nr:hypothetical protein [Pilimelia sp.]